MRERMTWQHHGSHDNTGGREIADRPSIRRWRWPDIVGRQRHAEEVPGDHDQNHQQGRQDGMTSHEQTDGQKQYLHCFFGDGVQRVAQDALERDAPFLDRGPRRKLRTFVGTRFGLRIRSPEPGRGPCWPSWRVVPSWHALAATSPSRAACERSASPRQRTVLKAIIRDRDGVRPEGGCSSRCQCIRRPRASSTQARTFQLVFYPTPCTAPRPGSEFYSIG